MSSSLKNSSVNNLGDTLDTAIVLNSNENTDDEQDNRNKETPNKMTVNRRKRRSDGQYEELVRNEERLKTMKICFYNRWFRDPDSDSDDDVVVDPPSKENALVIEHTFHQIGKMKQKELICAPEVIWDGHTWTIDLYRINNRYIPAINCSKNKEYKLFENLIIESTLTCDGETSVSTMSMEKGTTNVLSNNSLVTPKDEPGPNGEYSRELHLKFSLRKFKSKNVKDKRNNVTGSTEKILKRKLVEYDKSVSQRECPPKKLAQQHQASGNDAFRQAPNEPEQPNKKAGNTPQAPTGSNSLDNQPKRQKKYMFYTAYVLNLLKQFILSLACPELEEMKRNIEEKLKMPNIASELRDEKLLFKAFGVLQLMAETHYHRFKMPETNRVRWTVRDCLVSLHTVVCDGNLTPEPSHLQSFKQKLLDAIKKWNCIDPKEANMEKLAHAVNFAVESLVQGDN